LRTRRSRLVSIQPNAGDDGEQRDIEQEAAALGVAVVSLESLDAILREGGPSGSDLSAVVASQGHYDEEALEQILKCGVRVAATPVADAFPPVAAPPAATAVDPVCGMSVVVSSARQKTEVEGVMYYFCCASCRSTFLKDPRAYAAHP